jgi:murein L,D-transpeptidase YcbB/YkuD
MQQLGTILLALLLTLAVFVQASGRVEESLPPMIEVKLVSNIPAPAQRVEVKLDSNISAPAQRVEVKLDSNIPAPAQRVEVIRGRRFQRLEDGMKFYEALDRAGEWRPIPKGPLLRMGDHHDQVPLLRALLIMYGELQLDRSTELQSDLSKELRPHESESPELFDSELHEALVAFQQRHGTEDDGILGPKTRRIFNVSPRERADQLKLNIDRQQTFMATAEERYIQVNIPEFRLRLVDAGLVLLEMKTIIGRRSRKTPVLNSTIKTLVVNPDWNVPKSIAFKDILPQWEKDTTYLAKHNLRIISGWETPRRFVPEALIDLNKMYRGEAYQRLWEPPGEKNPLGRVKFLFSNPYSVYLHDTPARHLFEPTKRAFSSGCIRLEKAQELASTLLRLSNQSNPEQLELLFEETEMLKIRLKEPVPLHVTYWTAWLDRAQILHFGSDLYQLDRIELVKLTEAQKDIDTGQ